MNTLPSSDSIAPLITKAASKQTYYTIRFLADPEYRADAYRAYAYFRWVDDTLDERPVSSSVRNAFIQRQKNLLERCYRGEAILDATIEENLLIHLIQRDNEKNSGLQSYLRNMMQVMEFDTGRRGRLISHYELNEYTRWLATAVTEAMHYFIGHGRYAPHGESRYLAVSAAHIAHMLRDTFDDVKAGYYNIPREVLEAHHIYPEDIESDAYRSWVRSRVQLARQYFYAGRDYLARVEEPRCRLAGLAYIARFDWLLNTIARENYCLRPEYSERKSLGTGVKMGLQILSSIIHTPGSKHVHQPVVPHTLRK